MALRKTGTRLVLEGTGAYIAGMKSADSANTGFADGVDKSGAAMGRATVKSVAFGNVIANVVTSALAKGAQAFGALASEAVSVYTEYEKLQMSMTSLVTKELRTADATLEMAEAKELAAVKAEELLGWIQDLAIKSPFDQQGVAIAFRTALAYGFTSDEARRLTETTIDFTTATGASGHVMGQVALALGQVKAKGKLAGGEMLQLVNAGINVRGMLDGMGYSMADVSAGLVTADEFMLTFVETMENDFGGAASDSAETMGGLINSLDDIRAMGLRALFGPMFKAALPSMAAVTGRIQELLPMVELLGSYIGRVTTLIIENKGAVLTGVAVLGSFALGFLLVAKSTAILTAVTTVLTAVVGGLGAVVAFLLSPIGLVAIAVGALAALFVASFSKIQSKTNGFFSGMGTDLFSFGENIIMSLAEGMAAAMTAVMQVLTAIGNMISHWLSPGSPPKLLPNIDKWGTSAMQEFIGGMGSADFDVFENLSSKFEGFMSSFAGEDDGGLNDRILDMRQNLMSAMGEFSSTGSVSENSFDKIFKSMKIANPALQNYAREVINVQMAQKKLNDITKKYSDLLSGHQSELDAISTRRKEVADDQRKTELESILSTASARGDALAVEMAQMELKEMAIRTEMALLQEKANLELDAADAELAAAEEKMNIQIALIDAQVKNNELSKKEADDLKAAIGGGAKKKKKGGKGDAAKVDGEGIGIPMEGISSGISDALGGLQGKFEQFVKDLAAPFGDIKMELDKLTDAWSNTFIAIGLKMAPFVEDLRTAWGSGGTYATIMEQAKGVITAQWGAGGTWEGNIDNLKLIGDLLMEHWNDIFGSTGTFTIMIKDLTKLMTDTFGEGGIWAKNFEMLKVATTLLQEKMTEQFNLIKAKFGEAQQWVDDLQAGLQKLKDWITTNVMSIKIDFPDIPEWAQHGSPLKLHHRMMDFQKFLKRETFRPKMDFDQPIRPVANSSVGGNTTNIYNQQSMQGIGSVSANGQSDIAIIQAVVERAIQNALRG